MGRRLYHILCPATSLSLRDSNPLSQKAGSILNPPATTFNMLRLVQSNSKKVVRGAAAAAAAQLSACIVIVVKLMFPESVLVFSQTQREPETRRAECQKSQGELESRRAQTHKYYLRILMDVVCRSGTYSPSLSRHRFVIIWGQWRSSRLFVRGMRGVANCKEYLF